MDKKKKDLSNYQYQSALETLEAAKLCFNNRHYKDAINRSYYAAFYAVKAVLALDEIDFKRHKDAVGYFNQNYVATEIFVKETGKKLGRLQKKREASDYDDFYLASKEEAEEQLLAAEYIIKNVSTYLQNENNASNWYFNILYNFTAKILISKLTTSKDEGSKVIYSNVIDYGEVHNISTAPSADKVEKATYR